ncbi:MAG: hypothetical protein U1B30_15980 [Pseudomonadota bacterium]|nr:hypothetical protein [Pseudomonadota bacterium]
MAQQVQRVINRFIGAVAERNFKQETVKLCTHIPPNVLEEMAVRQVRVADLIKKSGHEFPAYRPNPFVDYLMSRTDAQLLDTLEPVLPHHVEVLRRHPAFCADFISDLKRLAGMAAQE